MQYDDRNHNFQTYFRIAPCWSRRPEGDFRSVSLRGPCAVHAPGSRTWPQATFPFLFRRNKRDLLRQLTKGGFSTIGTILTIHRRGTPYRPSLTHPTIPKNFD